MITIETLKNGLSVIVEEISHVESAAYELIIPGGIVTDKKGAVGASLICAELTSRGAGGMDSKALSNGFEDAGIRHGEGGGFDKVSYRGSLLAEKLPLALTLVSQMVLDPALPEDELSSIKSLYLQDIKALEDNPARKCMVELGKRYYPDPFARPSMGTIEGIENASIDEIEAVWKKNFTPSRAILSVAGKVNAKEVLDQVLKLFGNWSGESVVLPKFGELPKHESIHIESDSAQLQIALSYPSVKFGEPLYYTSKVGSGILSGGMFGRLFIEVREKRGLCYSVFARHSATKDFGTVTAYAGTTPARAQETLDVMVKELRSIPGTVTKEELQRAKANLKSSLIISEESAGARASSNASDYFLDGRVRSLDEISDRIDVVGLDSVDQFFTEYPANSFMLLTLGATKLVIPAI